MRRLKHYNGRGTLNRSPTEKKMLESFERKQIQFSLSSQSKDSPCRSFKRGGQNMCSLRHNKCIHFSPVREYRLTGASSQGHPIRQEDLWPMALMTNWLNRGKNSMALKYGKWWMTRKTAGLFWPCKFLSFKGRLFVHRLNGESWNHSCSSRW